MASNGVLLLSRTLDVGGSERQLAETAKALHRRGWNVHVACFHAHGGRADELRSLGVPVLALPVRSFASWSAIQGLAAFHEYVRRHDLTLVHSFDMPASIFGTFAGRLSRRPVVLSSQRCYRELCLPREHRLLRIADKLASGVVVNCEAIRRHLIEDEGVPAERIHLCYNGIDTDRFFPAPVRRPEFADDVVIGTLAVLRPEKGLPTLMEGFASLNAARPHTRLVIVGSGPMRQSLQQMAESLGVLARVHFEPATTEVAQWMNSMDVYVLPSLSEALSNSLMEAMACGVSCVTSAVGGNPELVREGETGLLFPSRDAAALTKQLVRLVDDADLRRRLGDAASSFIRTRRTIATAAACMEGIYSRMLNRQVGGDVLLSVSK